MHKLSGTNRRSQFLNDQSMPPQMPRKGAAVFYRKALESALADLGELAKARVAVGVFNRCGNALDWPRWMLEGTSDECRPPLPEKLRLADDLTIMANLLDRFGAAPMLSSMLYDVETLFGRRYLEIIAAAPDFITLLHFLIKAVNVQNPHASAAITVQGENARVAITALPALGPLGAFIEQAWAGAMMRSMSLFSPRLRRVALGPDFWPTLMLRGADDATLDAVRALGCVHVAATDGPTMFLVPAGAPVTGNATHDPEVWGGVEAQLRKKWIDDTSMMSIGSLRLHIRQTLEAAQRAPGLDELAEHLGMSKRTVSRKLAALDVSFQTIVGQERMQIARRLLRSGRVPVRSVAKRLGFGSTASFGRAFRQEHGLSPAEWRDQQGPALPDDQKDY